MKTLKSKISLGVIFLFAVILLLSVLGIMFINHLAHKSRGTIVENYSSVNYMMNMISELDDINTFQIKYLETKGNLDSVQLNKYRRSINLFEKNLHLETKIITEPGESELVHQLLSTYKDYLNNYEQLRKKPQLKENDFEILQERYLTVRTKILDIYKINMTAITHKTNNLQTTADDVTLYMSIVATLSILITLSFIFTFPSSIVGPIKELTEKIKSISERNYDQKLEIHTKDELGELANAFNVMAARLKLYDAKQIDQLLFEQKRLEAVVHSFEDGILFIDENRKVVLVNNTILQLTGLKEQDVLHHYIPDVAAYNDLIREIYKTVLLKISDGDAEIKLIRIAHEGKEFFFNVEVEEIITYAESEKKETFIGNLILLRNITKYQERDKAKTNLLATASHELKTPLSSINLSLKLLDDKRVGVLNDEQKEIIAALRQHSNRLSRVINELLDYSQIETGNIRLKFTSVKPDIVLDIGVTALMMQVSEKNIDLQTVVEEDLPEIHADLEKLVFVFINILNNAIRYSKKGDEIKIEVKKVDNDVQFSIKDIGPGISKEDKEKLFHRFTQVGEISKQGWGLGLAISKEFINAQNGRIWVESELGKGSKFIFSIPGITK
ncbi:MAG: ATP-binding protein [Ignavibacteria bacterium]|nr:ATP-binding protein [Ignavibacteria bacterium]